ncbi:CPBP family glutamic-type intramembrane protease [Tessaracoccus palaemonis]|uniref:CPBP family intramembrane metalloprotease n=1 Tax=Tessaracoccus palaemonis TaxID=2829499 RepID=A0ABX8SPN9_9ACTN|nr:CPBP family glutamic-type intramembrane protease [Tessaracoccus palaemonis]QXT63179.1 CPBP family intramembrane metalloprotease [Tessaracoccus palaemonis]
MTTQVVPSRPAAHRPTRAEVPFDGLGRGAISGPRWVVILAACAVEFDQFALLPATGTVGHWAGLALFPIIPLAALMWATPTGWTALVRGIGPRDLGVLLGVALACLATVTIGSLALSEAGPLGHLPGPVTGHGLYSFLLEGVPHILGEELVAVLPMLALASGLRRLSWSRSVAQTVASVVVAGVFVLLHLPTSNWNVVECVVLVGVMRLVLAFGFFTTRSLWVPIGAHLLSDLALFTMPLLVSAAYLI